MARYSCAVNETHLAATHTYAPLETAHVRVVVHVRRSAGPHIRVSLSPCRHLSLSLPAGDSVRASGFLLLPPARSFTPVELVHILSARIIWQSRNVSNRFVRERGMARGNINIERSLLRWELYYIFVICVI